MGPSQSTLEPGLVGVAKELDSREKLGTLTTP